MAGLLNTDPLRGLLYQEPAPAPQPQGLLGAATMNPLMARQIAAQRAANPRPDVTDFMGYGPTWDSYLSNMNRNLQAQLPQMTDSGTEMAQKAAGMLGNFGGFGITAFHGTPHKFDKFDINKVGTGEGATAYGHGLYFAENQKVADAYAKELGKGAGKTYKVDIPDEAYGKMLDWNTPLKHQPESVQTALKPLYRDYLMKNGTPKHMVDHYIANTSGEDIYKNLVRNRGKKAASEMLKAAGVPGIRYLDQASRSGGGTHNIVLFDDQLAKIVE
jgi:hypothetical protein